MLKTASSKEKKLRSETKDLVYVDMQNMKLLSTSQLLFVSVQNQDPFDRSPFHTEILCCWTSHIL